MRRKTSGKALDGSLDWPGAIHRALKSHGVRQVSYVPDAGHKRLIELCHADKSMAVVPLTTEEEGIGLAAGAWLGGERAALLSCNRVASAIAVSVPSRLRRTASSRSSC
jgi:sulfopyruvate decarboxylase TPP-binding subunit